MKNQQHIDFPLEGLNFKKYMVGYDKNNIFMIYLR